METPSSEQRRRGRQRNTPSGASESAAASSSSSPSPARRRGCNCKKSGCLKLYCECFSAGLRCGDRCQCLGCKNRDHNKLEIAHALETIEKRSQRSFKSPVAVTRKLGTLRTSTPQAHSTPQTSHSHHHSPREFVTPSYGLRTPVLDGATRLLMSAERLEETPRQMSTPAALECICAPGSCHGGCPCHAQFGGCGRRCPCNQYVAPPPPVTPAQEKTRGCSCKKSNCLKLYCECLAAQRLCDSRCNCEGCKNHPDHVHERERAITAILERNPNAFQPKVASGAAQHQRGCNCRKSNCMKNYCECHQAGVPCTGRCACQDCRNTDAFVSAKKMLIFSGDLKVRGGNNMGTPDHRMHAMTPSSAKPPRRPPRRASLDHSSPPSHFQTPTLQPSSALEMLSRTAPPAPQQDAYAVLARMQTNVKRKLSDSTYEDDGAYDSSTDAKKRGTKTTVSRPNFQERLERAASSETAHLPPVESVLKDELDPSQPDLPLSKLCRSLLNAATSAEASPTPRKPERSPGIVRGSAVGRAREVSNQDQQHTEPEGAVSPMTDDLLCEEDIETPTRGKVVPPEGEERQRASTVRLAALQERAVLQEFSVWLRNLATSATPTKPPLPQ